jgi:hypothetical protein
MEKADHQNERPYPRQVTLPIRGGTVKIERRILGKDLRKAERISRKWGRGATARQYAAAAQVCEIDGQPMVMEDFDELDAEDITAFEDFRDNLEPVLRAPVDGGGGRRWSIR